MTDAQNQLCQLHNELIIERGMNARRARGKPVCAQVGPPAGPPPGRPPATIVAPHVASHVTTRYLEVSHPSDANTIIMVPTNASDQVVDLISRFTGMKDATKASMLERELNDYGVYIKRVVPGPGTMSVANQEAISRVAMARAALAPQVAPQVDPQVDSE